jgi:hypothetical protein
MKKDDEDKTMMDDEDEMTIDERTMVTRTRR